MTLHGDIILGFIGTFVGGIIVYSITKNYRKKYISSEVAPNFDNIN